MTEYPDREMLDTSPKSRTLGPRNLPRASHACQRCRTKKGRCNQQRPCSTCVRTNSACIYGERRKTNKNRDDRSNDDTLQHEIIERSWSLVSGQAETALDTNDNTFDNIPSSVTPNVNIDSVRSEETFASNDRDVVGEVNQRTQGTEFYGTSSNYVLLNQLFSHVRQQSQARHVSALDTSSRPATTIAGQNQHASSARISLVNLLANDDELLPPSREKSPLQSSSSANQSSAPMALTSVSGERSHTSNITVPALTQRTAERRLEEALVRSFMHNLHYLHPMIDNDTFNARYEAHMAEHNSRHERSPSLRHFFALYNIIVAVGALVAGSDFHEEFGREIRAVMQNKNATRGLEKAPLQGLSRHYFQRSRSLLGDVFEACSLESAQTLFLMSLYCQNSLKPHACYMYCGMAVRTALAIGLPSQSMSNSPDACKAARRTWWCIYSHEILGKPRKYPIPLPRIKSLDIDASTDAPDLEGRSISMINVMVDFAVVLRRISKEIYHCQRDTTISEKSSSALHLDTLLDEWKRNLPPWHNFDAVSFREPEWAAKQKLVLQLRYLNARVILHRPFMSDTAAHELPTRDKHIGLCLDAARNTIQVLYDSYANKHYFRTWWYNSTYTLYAGMILLYIVMLGNDTMTHDSLLEDVKKSRDILRSMEEASVARRSADLLSEVLEVATAYMHLKQGQGTHQPGVNPNENNFDGLQQEISSVNDNAQIDFAQDPEAFMASLIDPNILQDFTTDFGDWTDLDFALSTSHDTVGVVDHRDDFNPISYA
ncbi:hypothetical protein AUEXF2481DRAFT_30633 [Aureobasidium subglaciale EXF-2481]|uniref:Zn(2)-C6 fungal-type domain-containing protein n=1 Tax=Aureobasidium subglaciale (strain EXF-2481) TaxID=1043005 RepID=A0A074Y8N0_AURSE|nr:uncharacterized protein AUEXF2481DRAFT_30633 [Aureobasidium subglaciale EXF-2481]KEQ94085.1 hypothetical protein AUEXF2481DRAFT_30633 [Aureobasidium subglaciale EXF-2481]